MEFLVRMIQMHPSFRRAELEALAKLEDVDMEILEYSEIRLTDISSAQRLIRRSILSRAIYALWGQGATYTALHASTQSSAHFWPDFRRVSFKFSLDTFQASRTPSEQKAVIESFSYLGFEGLIDLSSPDEEFCVFEEYDASYGLERDPHKLYMGRLVAKGGREAVNKYSLKKRDYIATTSMDAELALLTANITLAKRGKLFYDPFVGTGSLPIACTHFGAFTIGSDIDGRSIRGTKGKNLIGNFRQYGLEDRYLDGLVCDFTNSPLKLGKDASPWLDGIVCDPPYGVREGLKVLGSKAGGKKEPIWVDGVLAHIQDSYIPPKKPYSFEAMLKNILDFASVMLTEDARLSLWMPTANDEEVELEIPLHTRLELLSVCVQPFNRWSRRLLTYRKLTSAEPDSPSPSRPIGEATGIHADDLNNFRKRYFQGFKSAETT